MSKSRVSTDILERLDAAFPSSKFYVQIDNGFRYAGVGMVPVTGWSCEVRGRAIDTRGIIINQHGHPTAEAAIEAAILEGGR